MQSLPLCQTPAAKKSVMPLCHVIEPLYSILGKYRDNGKEHENYDFWLLLCHLELMVDETLTLHSIYGQGSGSRAYS